MTKNIMFPATIGDHWQDFRYVWYCDYYGTIANNLKGYHATTLQDYMSANFRLLVWI